MDEILLLLLLTDQFPTSNSLEIPLRKKSISSGNVYIQTCILDWIVLSFIIQIEFFMECTVEGCWMAFGMEMVFGVGKVLY